MIKYLEYSCEASTPTIYLQREPVYHVNSPLVRALSLNQNEVPVVDLGLLRVGDNSVSLITPSGEYLFNVNVEMIGGYKIINDAENRLILVTNEDIPSIFVFSFLSPNALSLYFDNHFYFAISPLETVEVDFSADWEVKVLNFPSLPQNTSTSKTGFFTPSSPYTLEQGKIYIFRIEDSIVQGVHMKMLKPLSSEIFPFFSVISLSPLVGNNYVNYIRWNNNEVLGVGPGEIMEVQIPEEEYNSGGLLLKVGASSNKFGLKSFYDVRRFLLNTGGEDTLIPPAPMINTFTEPGGYIRVEISQNLTAHVFRQVITIGDESTVFMGRTEIVLTSVKKYATNTVVPVNYKTMRRDGTVDIDVTVQHTVFWSFKNPDNLRVI